jgi:hypothetical protein
MPDKHILGSLKSYFSMKKQYDVTKLTDELSKSVFFQEPGQAVQSERQNETNQDALAPTQQSDLARKQQNTEELKLQSTNPTKHFSTKEPGIQSEEETKQKSTLALKHFSSYLQPGTYKAWKMLATEREKKDYEILQEAVEQYLERVK